MQNIGKDGGNAPETGTASEPFKTLGGGKRPEREISAGDARERTGGTGSEGGADVPPEGDEPVVLAVENLKKRYGKNPSYAVDGVSFAIRPGEIVGLVGTNGAGKSTTIKCVTGYLPFDEGSVTIAGVDIEDRPVEAKRNFGYVPDDRAVFEKMSGIEYLSFVADLRRVGKAERKERIDEFQERFKLGDKIYRPIDSYSHGMRQKICLMASLIHKPKLWILDEPMTGLDPQTTKSLKDTMVDYGKAGNAVLFSSHNLEIVEKISDRVVMIQKGKKIADGTIASLRAERGGRSFEELFLELYGDEA